MNILEQLDSLRGRVTRLRVKRNLTIMARDMGIAHMALRSFMRGRDVNLGTIRAIERWCDAQEVPYADTSKTA